MARRAFDKISGLFVNLTEPLRSYIPANFEALGVSKHAACVTKFNVRPFEPRC
jgi:hypothetical protein